MTQATVPSTPVPSLNQQRIYLKGISVEMPHAPYIFLEQGEMQMHLDVAVTTSVLGDDVFEVLLRGTLTGKLGDKVVYLVEALQAGVFVHSGIPAEQMAHVHNVVCPTLLLPYLRVNIADAITRTSNMPFHIPEVSFQAMFAQQFQAQSLANVPTVGGLQ